MEKPKKGKIDTLIGGYIFPFIRYLILTELNLLSFGIENKQKNSLILHHFASIKSIANIKKNKENKSKLVFTFNDSTKQVIRD